MMEVGFACCSFGCVGIIGSEIGSGDIGHDVVGIFSLGLTLVGAIIMLIGVIGVI